jgi:hypothetical protein
MRRRDGKREKRRADEVPSIKVNGSAAPASRRR